MAKVEVRTTCRGCGDPIPRNKYRGNPRQWCSDACRVSSYRKPAEGYKPLSCRACKAYLGTGSASLFCSEKCREIWSRRPQTCTACGGEFFNGRLKSPHPMSATFDHLIPISDGGTDAPENLALAHRVCNTRRGAGGIVQLLLVG